MTLAVFLVLTVITVVGVAWGGVALARTPRTTSYCVAGQGCILGRCRVLRYHV